MDRRWSDRSAVWFHLVYPVTHPGTSSTPESVPALASVTGGQLFNRSLWTLHRLSMVGTPSQRLPCGGMRSRADIPVVQEIKLRRRILLDAVERIVTRAVNAHIEKGLLAFHATSRMRFGSTCGDKRRPCTGALGADSPRDFLSPATQRCAAP